jgi:hypothetical protein
VAHRGVDHVAAVAAVDLVVAVLAVEVCRCRSGRRSRRRRCRRRCNRRRRTALEGVLAVAAEDAVTDALVEPSGGGGDDVIAVRRRRRVTALVGAELDGVVPVAAVDARRRGGRRRGRCR